MYDPNPRRRCTRLLLVGVAAAAALLAFAGSAGANGRYTDKTGDSGSAQDIAGAEVSADAAGQLTFRVNIPNMQESGVVGLFIDSDANPATGNTALDGVDYFFVLIPSARTYDFGRWTGSDWSFDIPYSTVHVSHGSSGAMISVNRSELSNAAQVNFWAMTVSDSGGTDIAPDDGVWNFDLAAGGPDIREILVQSAPASGPRVGKPFTVSVAGIRLPQTNVTDPIQPESYTCTATLNGKAIVGTGTGGCSFAIPKKKSMRGKTLSVTVSVAYQGVTKTQTLVFRVKK